MNHEIKPIVISVSSISGGGKTTIINLLKNELKNSRALYFDDYDLEASPVDFGLWLDRGANYNEWNISPLLDDVASLFNEKELDYILLDYPFSYLNEQLREYINLSIYIDTPLDIAMARRLLRDFKNTSNDVFKDLENYINMGRQAYLEMIKQIKPSSDLVVDGSLAASEIIEIIKQHLKTNKSWNHASQTSCDLDPQTL